MTLLGPLGEPRCPPGEEIKPHKQASRWHCFGCSVNLRGGSEFAEDVSLNAAAQLEHKHVDMCHWIFLLQSVTGRCVAVRLGESFPLLGRGAALRPVI